MRRAVRSLRIDSFKSTSSKWMCVLVVEGYRLLTFTPLQGLERVKFWFIGSRS